MDDVKQTQAQALTADQLEKIGGGGCTPADLVTLAGSLTQAYEDLIDFTSHVIERVVTSTY
jgi:hypothetical protein